MPTNLTHKNEPILTFSGSQELEAHMSNSSESSKSFWLRLAKAGAPTATIGKEDAIEAALCCGWIDGQLARFDEHYLSTPVEN